MTDFLHIALYVLAALTVLGFYTCTVWAIAGAFAEARVVDRLMYGDAELSDNCGGTHG